MVIVDKWGTKYPSGMRDYIIPREVINTSQEVEVFGSAITSGSKTTDEAILKIHEYMKNETGIGHVPLVYDVPVRKASDQLTKCRMDPSGKNLCVQKTILEVALLRSQGIPARVGVAMCGTHTSRLKMSPLIEGIVKLAPDLAKIPLTPHAFTEVFVTNPSGEGKFRRKDSYMTEKFCKKFPGTCTDDQKKQWMERKDVPDIQSSLNCIKIASYKDFPKWLSIYVNLNDIARDSSHVIDLVDPITEE